MSDAVTTEATPGSRPPPVPWRADDLGFLVFLAMLIFAAEFFWPSMALELLHQSRFFSWYYRGVPGDLAERQRLWALALAFPVQLATVIACAGLFLGVWPAALGLQTKRLGRNLLAGVIGAIVLTPLVLGLHNGIVWLYTSGLGLTEQKHPLGRLGELHLSAAELVLWLFTAMVSAPVVEELLFRGVFQPAARRTRWGGLVGVGLALAMAAAARYQRIADALRQAQESGWQGAHLNLLDAFFPVLFVVALLAVLLVVQRWSQTTRPAAIFGTSAFFAMIHVGVWPSPLALFVLALGLGWLKEQTQSIVSPIVVHALFNATSCALVLFGMA